MPHLGITRVGAWTFAATPILGAAPHSTFYLRTGFELGFVFGSKHTAAVGWAELQRLVEKHDRPTVQELVVTVGGPDRMGYVYPAEEAVLDLMLTQFPAVTQPGNLRRVYLHGWGTGRILQVVPDFREIASGAFLATVPAHQALVPGGA